MRFSCLVGKVGDALVHLTPFLFDAIIICSDSRSAIAIHFRAVNENDSQCLTKMSSVFQCERDTFNCRTFLLCSLLYYSDVNFQLATTTKTEL